MLVALLWIVNGMLALAFLGAGLLKATRSNEQLRDAGMAWTDGFTSRQVTLIGVAEVLGALGLVLPLATGIAPLLAPVAAAALAVTMVGAVVVHVRRGEQPTPAVVLGVLSLVSAVLGAAILLG